MKKNNMGFFLAETIVMIALVTTVMAFVFPNVSKIYDNYKNQIKYYDQTEDIYVLKAVYEKLKTNNEFTTEDKKEIHNAVADGDFINKIYKGKSSNGGDYNYFLYSSEKEIGAKRNKNAWWRANGLSDLYIVGYMETPSSDKNLSFDKYLKRMKKTTYDDNAYRLIGVFDTLDKNGEVKSYRYASIKIQKAW